MLGGHLCPSTWMPAPSQNLGGIYLGVLGWSPSDQELCEACLERPREGDPRHRHGAESGRFPRKYAIKWTRLSCVSFRANAVRLQLHALAYNLANFLRTLALPGEIAQWSLTSLREKLVKIGAKVVAHGRYLVFQMAEVAMPRELFRGILERIARLRPPDPAPC